MIWWPGLGNINRGFHLRNLRFRTDFYCRYYGIFTQRELADYNYDYDYMCFPVCLFQKDYFDFLSDKMRPLGKTISKNFEKDTKKHRFVIGIINQTLKDAAFQSLPFKICNHSGMYKWGFRATFFAIF